METLIVSPKNQKQLDAIEAVLKTLNVSYKKEETYNPEFIAKIERSKKEFAKGNYITVDSSKSIWDSIL